MSFFGLDKFSRIMTLIRTNGGLKKSLRKLYINDDLKIGQLVGTDRYGNKYFENNEYFYGRNRWVEYNEKCGVDYDGSMIPAEWFGWMHYKTDLPPTKAPPPNYKWIDPHTDNLTGTPEQYVPYSTTKPKIQTWTPPKKSGGGSTSS